MSARLARVGGYLGAALLVAFVVASCGGSGATASASTSLAPSADPTPTSTPYIYVTPKPRPTPTRAPTPEPTIPTFDPVTDREWALLVKDPDAHTGEALELWVCITQFDAATGNDTFRGDASNRQFADPFDWSLEGENAMFVGLPADLADFVEDDVLKVQALAEGSLTYETQAGGSTTVPLFGVFQATLQGSCA